MRKKAKQYRNSTKSSKKRPSRIDFKPFLKNSNITCCFKNARNVDFKGSRGIEDKFL